MIFSKIVNQYKPKSQFLYKTANVLFSSAQEAEKAFLQRKRKNPPKQTVEPPVQGMFVLVY